jgi:hypothetical protein
MPSGHLHPLSLPQAPSTRTGPLAAAARGLVMFAGMVALIVAAAVVLRLWFGGRAMVLRFDLLFAVVLVSSICASAVALVAAAGVLTRNLGPAVRWAVYLPLFAAAGGLGTLLTGVVLFAAGRLPREAILVVFEENFRGTIPTTIAIGVITMTFESWKSRLRETELELRTQQLERERAERLASEAQLASLSARVQPHFLFNTLNAIAALVRDNPREAEQMVERLSSVLRGSLDQALTLPLERELALVEDYLEIQRARHGDRLRFAIECDAAAAAGATVPPFAVQTLIENAVIHVAGRRADGVDVHVRVHRRGDDVLVDVTDNGEGFGPEVQAPGHGLDNLRGRLRALFGERAGLELDRGPGRMTVRLRVPGTAVATG